MVISRKEILGSPSFFVGYIEKIKSDMSLKNFKQFLLESEEEDKTYSFEELSPEAKENAIEQNRDINTDHSDWHDPVIEGFEEDMKKLGLDDIEVRYTGFYSQGDGASFTAKVVDPDTFLRDALDIKHSTEFLDMGDDEETSKDEDDLRQLIGDLRNVGYDTRKKLEPEDLYLSIVEVYSRYSHEMSIEGDVEMEYIDQEEDEDRDWNEFHEEMESMLTDWARKESKELYSSLYKYYEELQEDEAVAETLIANDYEFDAEGNIV